jgi:hypothetical protein
MPRISYKSFLARTSLIVAATLSNPGFAGVWNSEDDDEDDNFEDGSSESWTQDIGLG